MPEVPFPSEHHDALDPQDVEVEAAHNMARLESKYQDDIAVFKATVFEMLARHGIVHDGLKCVLFNVNPAYSDTLAEQDGKTEVLILCSTLPSQKYAQPMPRVRILTNQKYRISGGRCEWLAEDIVVDEDGDAQYYIDAISNAAENVLAITPLERAAYSGSLAPLFSVVDGGSSLKIYNLRPYTPIIGVTDNGVEENDFDTVMPFGYYPCLDDKIYALAKASTLINAVHGLEPVFHSSETPS